LAVSERTFLPVVVPLRETATIRARIQDMVGEVLLRLRVPQASFESEHRAMTDAAFGKTVSRRVLGVLVDFAHALQADGVKTEGLIGLSLELADTPCGPLNMQYPSEATQELLARASNEPA